MGERRDTMPDAIAAAAARAETNGIRSLFEAEPDRFETMSRALGDMILDVSKTAIDADALQALDVGTQIVVPASELEEGIGHELAGAVVRDMAAALAGDDSDACLGQQLWGEDAGAVAAAAEGDDGLVLGQQEGLRGAIGNDVVA